MLVYLKKENKKHNHVIHKVKIYDARIRDGYARANAVDTSGTLILHIRYVLSYMIQHGTLAILKSVGIMDEAELS